METKSIHIKPYLKKIIFVMLISIFLAAAVSCQKNMVDHKQNSLQTAPNGVLQSNAPEVDIEEIKTSLKVIINEDIWYSGTDSEFYNFQNQKTGFEVYYSSEPRYLSANYEQLGIVFDKSFKNNLSNSMIYYWVLLHRYKAGYGNCFSGYSIHAAKEELYKFNMYQSSVLVAKGEIEFGGVSEPVYPPLNDRLEKRYDLVEKNAINDMSKLYESGKYTLSIKKIREDDLQTEVVVVDSRGKYYYGMAEFSDDDEGASVRPNPIDLNNENYKYLRQRVKKISETGITKAIEIKKAGNPSPWE